MPQHFSRRRVANVVLVLVVVIFVVGAIAAEPQTEFGLVLLSLGASLAALGLLQVIWLLAGGEPMQMEVERLGEETTKLSDEIRSATDTLRDLHHAGIERIYATRSATGLIDQWLWLGEKAREIDLLGLTMFHEWLQYEKLSELLVSVARRPGGKVRILVLPPVSTDGEHATVGPAASGSTPTANYEVRRQQPGENDGYVLDGLLQSAHKALDTLKANVPRNALEVRCMRICSPYVMLVRIGSYMYVAPYLSSEQGEKSFAMAVRGPEGLYDLYKEEFDKIWHTEDPAAASP
jgi:hypothetical protein